MDATIRCQFDVIMDNFKEIKYKHTCLEEEYKTMELLYIKQKERIGELESYRNQLIKLLRKQMDKANTFKTTVESLQKENNNLNATIQDQNLLLNEYSTTIDQLKKENTLWKNKCNKPKNVSDKRIQKPNKNSVNSNFSHPSFINNSSPTSVTKLKKKSPLVLPNRYTNLDISVDGIQKKEALIKETKSTSAKKRKLFFLKDDTTDLTIEHHE